MALEVAPVHLGRDLAAPQTALDRWTMAYACFASVVIVGRGGSLAAPLVTAHAALVGVALLAPRLRGAGSAGRFIAAFYPLLAVLGLYSSIGLVNAAGTISHDVMVQRWEAGLFGGQPSRDWIRAVPDPALSWTLHVAYLSYYMTLAAAPLGLWLSGRRESARHVAFLMMITFYLCYAAFLVFPVTGPRYVFPQADNAATAVLPARLAQRLLDGNAAWGTAFPSSHVAVSLVGAGAAVREWPAFGMALLVPAVLLTFGTVYGQFHYASDAIAGAVVAATVLALTRKVS
jgi:membrane-associated phospholipid phosphatase